MRPSQWPLWKKILAAAIVIGGTTLAYRLTYAFADSLPRAGQWLLVGGMLAVFAVLWFWGKAIERRRR